jgi:predicted deacylase
MTNPPISKTLKQAIQAIKDGDRAKAQKLLVECLSANPDDDKAWLVLAGCVDDPAKKRYCLQKALEIRPENQVARQALEDLTPRHAELHENIQAEAGQQSTPSQAKEPDPAAISKKPARRAAQRKKARLSCLQFSMLAFLSLIAVGALSGAGFILLQSRLLPYPQAVQSTVQPFASEPITPGPGLQFPPTWTWTPEPHTSPTAALTAIPPTVAVGSTHTQLPSITPFSWRWNYTIGYSVEKRPIVVYQFGAGQHERMIVAGIHGGYEWNTIALADELIAYLRAHPEIIPAGDTLYILRSLNPDGEARGHTPDGRANHNGVDLNHNWAANWKVDWNRDGCWSNRPTTAGAYPNSEPETQALANFLIARRVEALISYHSAGLGIFPSGDPPDPDSVRLAEGISAVSGYQYPPLDTGCEYTGTLPDWALEHGIVAVDLELPTATETDLETNLKILYFLLSWAPPQTPTTTPSATPGAETSGTTGIESTSTPTLEPSTLPASLFTPSLSPAP